MARTNPELWRRFLVERGLAADIAESWASFVRPNTKLVAGLPLSTDATPIGATKLGGNPDLPAGMPWPVRPAFAYSEDDRRHWGDSASVPQPLDFMGQIDLAEIVKLQSDLPLPDSGWLYFFFDARTQPWGFDPADAAGTRVLYVDDGTSLQRVVHPEGKSLRTRSVELVPGESLPAWASFLDKASEAGLASNRVSFEIDKLSGEDFELITHGGHAVGGWPAVIQSPMELKCQLASNGIDVGHPEGYEHPRVSELSPGAADWRLLLQLDSDEGLDWAWGDEGKLYFWCREQDIAERRFDRCWTVLQCY